MRSWADSRRKLTTHLLLLFLLAAVVMVMLVAGIFRSAWRFEFEESVRPHLVLYLEYLLQDIGSPPDPEALQRLTDRLPIDLVVSAEGVLGSTLDTPYDPARATVFHRHRDSAPAPAEFGEYGGDRYFVRTSIDGTDITLLTRPFVDRRGDAARAFLIGGILATLWLTWFSIRRMLRPVKTLEHGVQRFAEGQLDTRIEVPRRDELGHLADSFNRMAGEIQAMLESKRELLLAISHELRSPLTRAKVSLALLEPSGAGSEIGRDLDEMSQLVTQLIEAERLGGPHAVLQRQRVDVAELVRETVAEIANTDTVETLPEPLLVANLDPVRVSLMLRALVDNALRFNDPARGPVRVEARRIDRGVVLEVADRGRGISDAGLLRATEAFWREDDSRGRRTGGFGLGLYLCRRIAEAHGGELRIRRHPAGGTIVAVRLPDSATCTDSGDSVDSGTN